jgi:hypothetical protein
LLFGDDERFAGIASDPLLEAMLLHLRNLWEFLFTQTPSDASVAAIDFVPGWNSQHAFAATGLLRSIEAALHNHLGPLAWERISEGTGMPQWDWRLPVTQVVTAFDEFVQQLPEASRRQFVVEASRSLQRTSALRRGRDRRWTAATTAGSEVTVGTPAIEHRQ